MISMELLEREGQLSALGGYLARAASGSGRMVFVAGEAGAGKTAMVQRFCESLGPTATVMVGQCDHLSTPRPLGPLLDIALNLGGPVAELLASGRRDGVFEATLEALVSRSLPTVAVFEDVQWADESTLDLLRFLGRRLAGAPAMVVSTYRDDETGPTHPLRIVLGELATSACVDRIDVPPLTEDAVRTLAASSGIDPAALYRDTGGNAFFVTEVLASGASGPPAAVADAVLARANRLSPSARRALEIAAVIGNRVDRTLLGSFDGVDSTAVDECIEAGVLTFAGTTFAFRHELARQAVAAAIPAHRCAEMHAVVLGRLRSDRPRPDLLARLAHHAEEAGDADAVLAYAPAAGALAAGLRSHREAAAQYARALRFADRADAETRADLLERRSYECHLIDHMTDAVHAAEEALRYRRILDQPVAVGRDLLLLSRMFWVAGHGQQSAEAAAEALVILESQAPSHELALAYSTQSQMGMLAGNLERAESWGVRALELAGKLGDTVTLAHALNNVGTARLMGGDASGEALLIESLRLAREEGLENDVTRALCNLAACMSDRLEHARALSYIDEAITFANARDLYSDGLCLRANRADLLMWQGRWDESVIEARALIEEHQMSRISRASALVVLGQVRARRGEAGAGPLLDEALELATGIDELQYLVPVAAARAEAAWFEGRHRDIQGIVQPALEQALAQGVELAVGQLSLWLWKAGELDRVPEAAATPYRLQMEGNWEDAALYWDEGGFTFQAALARLDGDEQAVREALAAFEKLGAKPAAAEALGRLRAMGATKIPRGPRASTATNPDGLTSREQEIMGFLTDSLTNREIAARLFLSEKTVDHHVSAILGKLGVRTRANAVRHASRLPVEAASS
jgi:DNA-binding CsgD family transcriptional regulator